MINRDDNVPAMSEADVVRQVQQYADEVAALVGNKLIDPAVNSAPCEGKAGELSENVYYVYGSYHLDLPPDKHLATLARAREQWRARGYTISEDRTFPDSAEGTITGKNAADGYTIRLTSTKPPTSLALMIHSVCYRSPVPR